MKGSAMNITKRKFLQVTGRKPQDDDLERCNCPEAGTWGHMSCGWCKEHNGPMFECGCATKAQAFLIHQYGTRNPFVS
jgi:hypothetical protein